jgi:hypothetical protein
MSDTDKLLREHCSMHQGTLIAEKILALLDLNVELLTACKSALELATMDFPIEECKQQLTAAIAKAEALK